MAIGTESMTEERVRELAKEMYRQMMDADKKKKIIPSKQEMYDFLKALPEETSRKFETDLVGCSVNWADSVIKGELLELVELVHTHPDPNSEENKVAFAAFCVAVNYERRMKNSTAEEKWLHDYREIFGKDHVFYLHMVLLNKMGKATSANEEELKELLILSKQNSENLTDNVGGYHAFAESVALVFENAPDTMRAYLHDPKADWLGNAQNAASIAIAGDRNYAKFYCTYSRLLAAKGDFDNALKNIDKAIDKENNQRSDYAIRIGQYLSYSQQFRARKQMVSMESHLNEKMRQSGEQAKTTMDEYEKRMEEQEKQTIVKNMEFLGLFSGIVSFTIGSLTIGGAIAEQSIKNAAGLIVVLMGALMAVFAAFGIILHGVWKKKEAFRNVFVLLLGVAIIVGGIWFCLT